MSEWQRIARLREIFEARPSGPSSVRLGIGDDAATLAIEGTLVVSVDACVEHVHFERAWLSMSDLGYKATMAALSDLAAMGAEPVGILGSLVLPAGVDDEELVAIGRGQERACAEVGAHVVGGNLSRGGELAIHTTVLGRAAAVLPRAGARAGELVLLAGDVGLAAAGLRRLRDGHEAPAAWVNAWRRPRALFDAGLSAVGRASAAIDVSDGLAADVGHLAAASGVRVVLDEAALARPELGEQGLALALYGGEDYALVVTADAPIDGFRVIGRCEPGEGVWLAAPGGERRRPSPGGFDHFG